MVFVGTIRQSVAIYPRCSGLCICSVFKSSAEAVKVEGSG